MKTTKLQMIQVTDEERKMATRPNVYVNRKKYNRKKTNTDHGR